MPDYRDSRRKQDARGRIIGIALAAGAHLCLLAFGVFNGVKYLYPPPQEQSFLIDFSREEVPMPMEVRQGSQPRAEEVDVAKGLELVQKAQAQEKGTKQNKAQEASGDDFGDVEKYEPPKEKPIDRRALFHAPDNKSDKDTLAPQTSSEISDKLRAGHASGNTDKGKLAGSPNAMLKGRSTVGVLPKPAYTGQETGIVVVRVWVDQYGSVQKAEAGAEGTTLSDKKIWTAARNAAMESHFSPSGDAPALQEGTITYVFKVR